MDGIRFILNIATVMALAVAAVTAVVAVSYVDQDPGMGPLAMVLGLLFWTLPALIVAAFSFVLARIIGARSKVADAPVERSNDWPIQSAPRSVAVQRFGRFVVLAGGIYALWSVGRTVQMQNMIYSAFQTRSAETEAILWAANSIGLLGAAVPGLAICWFGYWLRGRGGATTDARQLSL